MLKVENLCSPTSGHPVANQFRIRDFDKVAFQSYKSQIVEIHYKNREIKIYPDWNYSNTTKKYLAQFLRDENFPRLYDEIKDKAKKGSDSRTYER